MAGVEKVKCKVTITDAVQPPGEPVVTLRVPKGGKAVFRRQDPNGRTATMQVPVSRLDELKTLGYLVEEATKPKAKAAAKKAEGGS